MRVKQSEAVVLLFIIFGGALLACYMLLKPETKQRTVVSNTVPLEEDKYTLEDFNTDLETEETKTIRIVDSVPMLKESDTEYISKYDMEQEEETELLEELNLESYSHDSSYPNLKINIQDGEVKSIEKYS